jgi:hypothetical protein
MGIPKESLIKWVSRHLANISEDGSVNHFELAYDGGESGLLRLEQFSVEGDDTPDAAEISTIINDVAETDASSRRGPSHLYAVMAFYGDDADHSSLTRFRLVGKASLRDEEIETEPGTEKGVTAQLMRHNEQIMMTMHRVVEATMGKLASDLDAERAKRERLEARSEDIAKLREELLDRKDERDAKAAAAAQNAERMNQILSMLMSQAPLLLAAVVGAVKKKASSDAPASKEPSLLESFKALLDEVDEQKLVKFAASLETPQQLKLLELVGKMRE